MARRLLPRGGDILSTFITSLFLGLPLGTVQRCFGGMAFIVSIFVAIFLVDPTVISPFAISFLGTRYGARLTNVGEHFELGR